MLSNLIFGLLNHNSKILYIQSLDSFSNFISGIYVEAIYLKYNPIYDFIDELYYFGANILNRKLSGKNDYRHAIGDLVYTGYIAYNEIDFNRGIDLHKEIYSQYLSDLKASESDIYDEGFRIDNYFIDLSPYQSQSKSINQFIDSHPSIDFNYKNGVPRMILQVDSLVWYYFGHFVVARIIEAESDYFSWLPGFYLWIGEKYNGPKIEANTFSFPALIKGYRATYGEEIKCVEAFYNDLFSYRDYLKAKVDKS